MNNNPALCFPDEWERVQLKRLFRVVTGATPSSGTASYWDGDIQWITPVDVDDSSRQVIESTERTITVEGLENCSAAVVRPGSIAFTKRAPIGKTALLGVEACSNQGCLLLEPRLDLDSRFYHYVLHIQKSYLNGLGSGSTFMEIGTDEIQNLIIPWPSKDIQVAISDQLDHKLQRVGQLVNAKKELLSILSKKRRAVIAKAVTQGLDPAAEMRDSGHDWLGEIPAHWEYRRLATLFEEIDERDEPDLPLLHVSLNTGVTLREFEDDKIERVASDYSTYKVARKGDIVFNKMRMWQGAVGIAPADGLVSPDYVVARSISDEVEPEFYERLFRTQLMNAEFGRFSHGLVWDRMRLYWSGFKNVRVVLPPREEQRQIADYILNQTERIDAVREGTERTIDLLEERRTALITEAVTGQLDPEPAELAAS